MNLKVGRDSVEPCSSGCVFRRNDQGSTESRPILENQFMIPMYAQKRKEAFHEPHRSAGVPPASSPSVSLNEVPGGETPPELAAETAALRHAGSWHRCVRKSERKLSMNRTPSPHPSPPLEERVPEGWVRGILRGSWSQCAILKSWRLPKNRRKPSATSPHKVELR